MKYQIHTRQQHAKRGKSGFHGPNTYVAVTIAPNDVIVPKILNMKVLRLRGIKIHFFGEGYAQHTGPKSALGQALAAAHKFCEGKN